MNVDKIKARTEDMGTKVEGCPFKEFTPDVQERVDQLVAAAVAAERERSAKVIDNMRSETGWIGKKEAARKIREA